MEQTGRRQVEQGQVGGRTWCKDANNLSFTKEKSKCLIICFIWLYGFVKEIILILCNINKKQLFLNKLRGLEVSLSMIEFVDTVGPLF